MFIITICQRDSNLIVFVAADLLRLDSSVTDDVDKLALNELFEVNIACCFLRERILKMICSCVILSQEVSCSYLQYDDPGVALYRLPPRSVKTVR